MIAQNRIRRADVLTGVYVSLKLHEILMQKKEQKNHLEVKTKMSSSRF